MVRYGRSRIKSFRGKGTRRLWQVEVSRKLPQTMQAVARRKLRMLNNAVDLTDLSIPPANQLEALQGERAGQHSIRINRQWRICFRWTGDAEDVEIVDDH